jgi:hypothetical protein
LAFYAAFLDTAQLSFSTLKTFHFVHVTTSLKEKGFSFVFHLTFPDKKLSTSQDITLSIHQDLTTFELTFQKSSFKFIHHFNKSHHTIEERELIHSNFGISDHA